MAKKTEDEVESCPEILVLGAAGQLGRELLLRLPEERVIGRAREALDVCDVVAVRKLVEELQPKIVINLASTNPRKSRPDQESNWRTNAWAVSDLVKTCAFNKAALIHISTVEVFEADQLSVPYKEFDPISPRTDYSQSKAAGEHAILAVSQYPAPEFVDFKYWILRTAMLYEAPTHYSHNSLQIHLTQAMRSRDRVILPADMYCSSTYVPHLAQQICWLVDNYESAPIGIYHVANQGHCSLYDMVQYILGRCSQRVSTANILRSNRGEFQRAHHLKVTPSGNQMLDCAQWDNVSPIPMPSWKDAAAEFANLYRLEQCT